MNMDVSSASEKELFNQLAAHGLRYAPPVRRSPVEQQGV